MNNIFVKNGLIAGILAIIVSVVIWLIDASAYLKFGPYVRLIIIVYFLYRTAKETRDANGGFINLAELFKVTFLASIVATLVFFVFNYLHYNFIDTNLVEIQKQIAMESVEKISQTFGSEDMMTEITDKLEEQDFSMGIGKLFTGWLINLIWWAIVSVIIAAIMKKKDPSLNDFA